MSQPLHLQTLALAAGLFIGIGANAATPAPATGDWRFHVDWGGALHYDMLCHLSEQAGALSGLCQGVDDNILRTAGTLDPASLTLEYASQYQQYDFVAHYEGKRDAGGAARGSIVSGTATGDFQGAPLVEYPVDQTAVWSLHARLSGGMNFDLFCSFKINGKRIKGPCGAAGGPVMKLSGTSSGSAIHFTYVTRTAGVDTVATFEGQVQPNGTLHGVATSDSGGYATFSARRP